MRAVCVAEEDDDEPFETEVAWRLKAGLGWLI